MKPLFNISAVAILLVVTSGVCFALWDVDVVSRERAKELGLDVRSKAAGSNRVSVELEFKTDGRLKDFSEVTLSLGKGENFVLSTPLKEDRSKPGRVGFAFSVGTAQLDQLTLYVRVPYRDGALGGMIHELRMKDFVEVKKSG